MVKDTGVPGMATLGLLFLRIEYFRAISLAMVVLTSVKAMSLSFALRPVKFAADSDQQVKQVVARIAARLAVAASVRDELNLIGAHVLNILPIR